MGRGGAVGFSLGFCPRKKGGEGGTAESERGGIDQAKNPPFDVNEIGGRENNESSLSQE